MSESCPRRTNTITLQSRGEMRARIAASVQTVHSGRLIALKGNRSVLYERFVEAIICIMIPDVIERASFW